MKHTIALLLTACSIAISPLANAGTNSGIIYFRGEITAPLCDLETDVNHADFFMTPHDKRTQNINPNKLSCKGEQNASAQDISIQVLNEPVPGKPDAYIVQIQYN